MKNALAIVSVTLLSTGCSPMLYSGFARPPATAPFGSPTVIGPLPIGRWDNVMRLPHGSIIDVLTPDGTPNVGPIQSATGSAVTIQVDGHDVEIDRVNVIRVDLVDLPGSEVQAAARTGARGALLGAGAMALVGFVIGGSAWPPPRAHSRRCGGRRSLGRPVLPDESPGSDDLSGSRAVPLVSRRSVRNAARP